VSEQTFAVREPPATLSGALRFLGPGFILSAAIVGSGELIATTALGARAGFILLWAIPFSCLVKVAVQLEYGRYSITHGKPSFEAWNAGTGPRLLRVHWSVYGGLLFLLSGWLGMAGVMGGAAQVLTYAFPASRIEVWVALLAVLLGLMGFRGKYTPIEITAALLNLVFVSSVLYCNVLTQSTQYALTLGDLAGGFTLRLPSEGMALLVAVFGITGVGSGEIVMYSYWCIEKGYAAWAGPREDSAEWARRARGWIRVMYLDAFVSMVVYTLATCGFYLLGAAVLRPQGRLADGDQLIFQLSGIFTNVLGEKSMAIFMICAFTVLFSTLFSNSTGLARLWADAFKAYRLIDTERERLRAVNIMSWLLPAIWALAYLAIQKPLFLVIIMGVSNAAFLLVVAYQAVVFRYKGTDRRLKPSAAYDVALWLSVMSIGFLGVKVVESILS
jgi:manganese transport protein